MRGKALLLALLLAVGCGKVKRSASHLEAEAGAAGAEAAEEDPSAAGRGGAPGAPDAAGGAGTSEAGAGDAGAGDAGAAPGSAGGGGEPGVCEEQRSEYAERRDQVVAEFASFGCQSANDCLTTHDPSNCADCSFLITTGAKRGVVDRLVILGQQLCTGSCARKSPITCPDVPPAECVMGRCVPGN